MEAGSPKAPTQESGGGQGQRGADTTDAEPGKAPEPEPAQVEKEEQSPEQSQPDIIAAAPPPAPSEATTASSADPAGTTAPAVAAPAIVAPAVAVLGLLREKDGVDVREDTAGGDGDAAEELVELLVVTHGELQVAGDDAGLLVVEAGAAVPVSPADPAPAAGGAPVARRAIPVVSAYVKPVRSRTKRVPMSAGKGQKQDARHRGSSR
jgi:hypothetical protein